MRNVRILFTVNEQTLKISPLWIITRRSWRNGCLIFLFFGSASKTTLNESTWRLFNIRTNSAGELIQQADPPNNDYY